MATENRLTLTANVESFGDHFIAYITTIKGMVVQATSKDEAFKELLTSLKAKMAFDLGLDIERFHTKFFDTHAELTHFKDVELVGGKAEKEINLQIC